MRKAIFLFCPLSVRGDRVAGSRLPLQSVCSLTAKEPCFVSDCGEPNLRGLTSAAAAMVAR